MDTLLTVTGTEAVHVLLGHEVIVLLWTVFIEQLIDSSGKKGEFFFRKILDDLYSLVGLFFRESFGFEPVDKFLHGWYDFTPASL